MDRETSAAMSEYTNTTAVAVIASAWLTFLLWVIGELLLVMRVEPLRRWSRFVWTVGAVGLVGHWLMAFGLVHDWSHGAALEATARQTRERVGVDWGGGVFVNYALIAWWLGDAVVSWIRPERWNRPSLVRGLRRGFFWFMWINGAVVFASGFRRVPAAVLCLFLLAAWWFDARRHREVRVARGRPADSV